MQPVNAPSHEKHPPPPQQPTYTPPPPSLSLLFSYLTRRDAWSILVPAIVVSFVAGGIAPFMTKVIGQVFDALAAYPASQESHQVAKDRLLHDVGIAAIELIALAAGTLVLSSIMASLWMSVGERNALRLRKAVYQSVTQREMEWFDLQMGGADTDGTPNQDDEGGSGAGGMMSKFTRDTDEVRMATSLNTGMLVQYLTTFLACLILALVASWSLTLVILSSIPLLVFVQGVSQALAIPAYNVERAQSANAGNHVERAVRNIATVKAFNAQVKEQSTVDRVLDIGRNAYTRCCVVWGATAGLSQFILFAMFVQGFWFGSKLVREGKISPGNVMAVFWACLVASSNLQLCVPLLVVLTKGKAAMSSLDSLINAPSPKPTYEVPLSPTSAVSPLSPRKSFPHLRTKSSQMNMTKIVPSGKTHGSFSLHSIRFAYPSRPDNAVLRVNEIYLPSAETTFVVGGSGSGKSTIAHLLLRLYDPQSGTILLDDRDLRYLDEKFVRSHVAAVAQTCVLFDLTVHENVAIGVSGGGLRKPEEVTREEVERVCRAALMHEFIRDLPDGYETRLGTGGASLSGGQRQRLAIARALLRDPTVLVLDEATSALDATSRVLVFEAIKVHRKNRTTIVITHDLSQITADDFVYVMKDGEVVEQGYRAALEAKRPTPGSREGEFRRMLNAQFHQGGFPVKNDADLGLDADSSMEYEEWEEIEVDQLDGSEPNEPNRKHASIGGAVLASWKHLSTTLGRSTSRATRRSTMKSSIQRPDPDRESSGAPRWMFDAVADLANPKSSQDIQQAVQARRASKRTPATMLRLSKLPHAQTARRRSFDASLAEQEDKPRPSLQFEPVTPSPGLKGSDWPKDDEEDEEFEREKRAMTATGAIAGAKRRERLGARAPLGGIVVDRPGTPQAAKQPAPPTLTGITRRFWPTLPNKLLIVFGLFFCIVNGALTPVFSVALSKLMELVGTGAQDTKQITFWGMIVLLIALADGIAAGAKFLIMEQAAMGWVTSLRKQAYAVVLRQDKTWFDEEDHSAERVVQIIVKDGDDARTLVATVLAQLVVVVTMLSVGLIWAMVRGWQLTLVGLAIGPVFALAMMAQSVFMAKYELRAKRTREEVSKRYFEAVSNVRAIRSMALEDVFNRQFDIILQEALTAGVKGAMVAGTGFGVANALIYLAEAVLFYVGAVMMANNTYSYLRLLETLNLVVFTVSLSSQLLTFVPRIAKANQAAADFGTILSYTQPTQESLGASRYPVRGDIAFKGVDFAYPQRADVPVLKQVSFTIADGECVAIVGPSGSGKSTIAALLQRLYEPAAGNISIGRFPLRDADTVWLRSHIAVVSQQAALFDASITDNILYGSEGQTIPFHEVERAARDANLDDFIQSLPNGYETKLGENASLISGGQAQRIQLARALVNGKANILLLDEFTSALDVNNQEALMATVMKIKEERTTIIVTHKLPVMRRCDRIIVVNDGAIVEEGTYDVLMSRKGRFWDMATAGDLASE